MVTKEVWSMSETPLPQIASAMHSDAPEGTANTGEYRARKRSITGDLRPVSAFSPGHRGHEPPASASPPASQATLSEDERSFVAALRAAGIASELNEAEQARTAAHIRGEGRPARRLSLLASYYEAEHDALAGQRRKASDRWFLFDSAEGLNAHQLLARLLDIVPELQGTELERVGGRDGTLVLRDDDDVCALEDEQELEGREAPPYSTISVCDLVRAINVLLDRRAVRVRLVGLIGDGTREGYLGLPSVAAGIALSSADYLAVADAEALLDLTGW
ncbi:MAG: hypothetical protein JWN48_2749 [Myxococcaceae bacterium]|nr:hypothetical protein [Myxococcaceae bacterium]